MLDPIDAECRSPRVKRKLAAIQEMLNLPLDSSTEFGFDADGYLVLTVERGTQAPWRMRSQPTEGLEKAAHRLTASLYLEASVHHAVTFKVMLDDNQLHPLASRAVYDSGIKTLIAERAAR